MLFEKEHSFAITADSDGLICKLASATEFQAAKAGDIGLPALEQMLVLKMLEEQGLAEEIGNGFLIQTDVAIQLDLETRDQLGLPAPWPGQFRLQVNGVSQSGDFRLNLQVLKPNGADAGAYTLDGPLLRLSSQQIYLPDEAQWLALRAVAEHQQLVEVTGAPDESENLLAIGKLQQATKLGALIDMAAYQGLDVVAPDVVKVAVEEDTEGNLSLTPVFGTGADPADITSRLHQLDDKKQGAIRVGNQIVVIDRNCMRGVREVLKSRRIDRNDVATFLDNPTAFINATLVDLDSGFSIRVRGAEKFQLAYFGATEGSGIEWFEKKGVADKLYVGVAAVTQLVKNDKDAEKFLRLLDQAVSAGAQEFNWAKGERVSFEDDQPLRDALEEVRRRVGDRSSRAAVGEGSDDATRSEPIVVGIDTHDEDVMFADIDPPRDAAIVIENERFDVANLVYQPYTYQNQGIRWILGLANNSWPGSRPLSSDELNGALLADDMGLGKTFMSLAAIAEYFRQCKGRGDVVKPALVVAPPGLLPTWRDEVAKVFRQNPFSEIVVLQADADLRKYRKSGVSRETAQSEEALGSDDDAVSAIQYALKTRAAGHTVDALDQPGRLVLTSYQALRDYMFSLCRVDWSFVVFDEAQNIKNPNALQTRAAKGLKAHFRLLVTGTPVENELRDFWCLFDTARPGLLSAYQKFRAQYIKPILDAADVDKNRVRLDVGEALRSRVGGLMLRRLKEDNLEGLPAKRIYVGYKSGTSDEIFDECMVAQMPSEQRERYDSVIGATQAALSDEAPGAALAGLLNLRAVSLHPDCISGGMPQLPTTKAEAIREITKSGKLACVLGVLEEIKSRQEKVIIFCINKNLQRFLQQGLSKIFDLSVHVINGDTKAVARNASATTRKSLISDFESHPGFGVIIMSPVAAGVGLTVVGANNVIHVERHWNPAKEAQATDRVYRIGQTRDVNVYIPVLHYPDPDTQSFDLNIAKLLANKVGLRDAIVTPDVLTQDELINTGIFGSSPRVTSSSIGIERLHTLGWESFEAFIAELLAKAYDATTYLTPKSSDYGCDVVVIPSQGDARLVQCKHTGHKKLTGHKPVTEIVGARAFYQSQFGRTFTALEVYTNARRFDREMKTVAKASDVSLFGEKEIAKILREFPITEEQILRRIEMPRWKPGLSLTEYRAD